MTEPLIIEEPRGSRFGWTRSRLVFLSASGLFALLTIWWAAEVILPFIMALIIAYVLTPAVDLCERAKLPRAISIILVYVVTLGGLYLAVAAMAPRLYQETMTLARDAPQITEKLTTTWAPRVEGFTQGILDRVAPPAKPEEPAPALEIQKRPDGSFTVGDEALYTLSVILRVLAPESECTKVDELVNQQLSATQKVIADEAARLEKLAESFGVSGTGMSYSAPLSVSAKLTSPRAASWINLIRDYDQLVEKFDILWLSHVISDSEHSKGIFNVKRVLMRCANDLRSLAIRSMAAAQRNGEHNVPDPRAGTALSKEAAPVVNGEAQEASPEPTQPAVLDAVEVPATEAAPEEAIA